MIAIPTQRRGDICSPKSHQENSGTTEYEISRVFEKSIGRSSQSIRG
jgi:hypothetical protein